MARSGLLIRGKDGKYLKETPTNKCKHIVCEFVRTVKSWFK